ncbi:uncharacterized protein LOC103174897 isoform X2 [Callorhinchus milii]|uniref:uncharacterized protein LOC103174897 isoform X2 n=1 Tax=Callorhinchus milii TaxID=7868 RepID=UPI001C3F8426|nr:uncharacterized protein LOC103174897 isoform X2 [Callorhinchus milii]
MSAPGGASEGTTLLLILWVSIAGSAQPQVSLSPEHIIITNGSAGFLRCDATGFYPQEILFRWVKVSHGRETDIIPSDFSTEYKGTNRDGTFSVSSQLRIRPNLDDDGNKYMCVVTHRTLSYNIVREAKLNVEESTIPWPIVGGVVGGVSLVLLLVLVLWCCCKKQIKGTKKGVPPRISELRKPDQFKHGVASRMNWEVTGFIPRMITITLLVRRKGKEPQPLYEWNLKNNEDPLEYDEKGLLLNSSYVLDGNNKEDSITAAIAKCVKQDDGTFSLKSTITICPDASEDDGAEVTLKVQHETLGKPLTSSVKLVIARVPPRISELSKTDQFKHGEESRTGWEVTGFTPRMITITLIVRRKGKEPQPLYEWNFKKNEDPLEYDEKGLLLNSSCILNGNKKEDSITASISKCVQLDDGTFSVKGMIIICPDASEDDGAEVTLKVHHESLKNPLASSVKLVIVGVAPTVTEIDLRPEIKHSEVASLSWSVTGFTPKPISIVFLLKRKGELKEKRLFHWRIPENGGIDDEAKMGSTALTDVRDRCEEDDAITTVTPHCVRKNNGTFSVNCSIWMTADMCRDDGAELIVEVYHKALKTPLTKTMALHVTGVPPQITEIKKPSEITPGELASLSWAVVGFSPRAISIVTFVKRKGEQKKKKVFHWRIPKKDGEPQEAKTASVPLENVTEGCEEDGSFTAVMPHYVRKNNGMFSVNCSVWMCADLSKDDGAELMVEVVHEALKVPLIGSVTLQVTDGGN